MIYELLQAPLPEGYADGLLPMAECKRHLRVTSNDEDELLMVLRDAAIEFIEQYCEVRFAATELTWRAERFPRSSSQPLDLSASPVIALSSVTWLGPSGDQVEGEVATFRLGTKGDVLPSIGGAWPTDVGGGIEIAFTAGYADDGAPKSLLLAAKMFLGHLWMNREAVVDSGSAGEVPFGIRQLCRPFMRERI